MSIEIGNDGPIGPTHGSCRPPSLGMDYRVSCLSKTASPSKDCYEKQNIQHLS